MQGISGKYWRDVQPCHVISQAAKQNDTMTDAAAGRIGIHLCVLMTLLSIRFGSRPVLLCFLHNTF